MMLRPDNEAALALPVSQVAEEKVLINYDDQLSLLYRITSTFSVTMGTVFTLLFFVYLFAFSWDSSFQSVLGFLP